MLLTQKKRTYDIMKYNHFRRKKDEKYHVVNRWCPELEEDGFNQTCKQIDDLLSE